MVHVCEKTRAKVVCTSEQTVFVPLNDKNDMKGNFHVHFRKKFDVKILLITRRKDRLPK